MPVPSHYMTAQSIYQVNQIGFAKTAALRAKRAARQQVTLAKLAVTVDPKAVDKLIREHALSIALAAITHP